MILESVKRTLTHVLNLTKQILRQETAPTTYHSPDEHMRVRGIGEEYREIFNEGIEYALGAMEIAVSMQHGIHHQDPETGVGSIIPVADYEGASSYYRDLTNIVMDLLTDNDVTYAPAVVITEATRLYWNKLFLRTIKQEINRTRGNPTVEGIRRSIRSVIPNRSAGVVKQGSSPSYCSLSGNQIIIEENTVKINTTVHSYKGVKVPVLLEVKIDG